MVTVMLSHEVKDFDTWHPLFLSDEGARTAAGFNLKGLYRAADNANAVTAVFEAPSAEAVMAFVTNPALKEKMELGGVISAPELKILNSVN